MKLVKELRNQAKDGTLAEVLQLPVILWRVRTDSSSFLRNRREAGSGDYSDLDNYDGYDDEYDGDYDDDDEDGGDDEDPQVEPTFNPNISDVNVSIRGNRVPEHPHRHHHGEPIDSNVSRNFNFYGKRGNVKR